MRKLIVALAVLTLACGGGEQGMARQTQVAAASLPPLVDQGASQASMVATGTVHEVEMMLTDDGNYIYRPDELTIKVGDTVRWINVNDFHNVAFYTDQIPAGAREFLEKSLADVQGKLGPIAGPLFTTPGQTFDISFAGAPVGQYGYFCTPHEALGMKATLTVEQ